MEIKERRPHLASEVRQSALIAAALALAAGRSPDSITTGELGRAVGLSQGAVFRHFPNKQALWQATLDWTASTLLERLSAAAGAATDPLGALEAVFLAHVDFVIEYPGVPRVIFHELQQAGDTPLKARVRQLMLEYRLLLLALLRQAGARGQIAAAADPAAMAALFIGSIQGLVMQSLISGDVGAMAGQARAVFGLLRHSLTPCTPSGAPP